MRWFGDLAERLHDTGWPAPVPLRPQSKAPLVAGWTRNNAEPVAATTLAAWVRRHPTAGIGHPAGHGIVFIDMDEDDPARATHLKALVREPLGVTPLRRIGRPPREVVVYRRAAGSVMPSVLAATPSHRNTSTAGRSPSSPSTRAPPGLTRGRWTIRRRSRQTICR